MSMVGNIAETFVEEYIIKKEIPYKKNIELQDNKHTIAEFDVIYPDVIIEIKGGESYDMSCKSSLMKTIKQFHRIKKLIPTNYKFYHFFAIKLPSDVYEFFTNEGFNIIYNLDDIEYNQSEYVYYTRDTAIIRLLGSLDDIQLHHAVEKYQFIVVPKYIYMRAVVGMKEENLAKLNQFQFRFTNDEPEKYIYLTIKKLSPNKEQLFNIFYEQIFPSTSLFNYSDQMILVDDITTLCHKCYEIKYDECVENNICSKCSGKKNKKRKPDMMIPIKSSKLKKMRFE